jgi:hypothetical protein
LASPTYMPNFPKAADGKIGDKFGGSFASEPGGANHLKANVQIQVEYFLRRQADDFLKKVFQSHKEGFKPGDIVEAQYKTGRWYPAKIASKNPDGTFTVNWDDGDSQDKVKPSNQIRPRSGAPANDMEVLTKEKMKPALEEAGFKINDEDVEALFETLDLDSDNVLDFQEFKLAVQRPSKTLKEIERWTSSMPFSQLIATGFVELVGHDRPIKKKTKGHAHEEAAQRDPIRIIAKCSDDEFSVVCDGVLEGIKKLLQKNHKEVKAAYEAFDKQKFAKGNEDDQSKFAVNTMSCGQISDFYKGLEGRVGKWQFQRVLLNLIDSMPSCRISKCQILRSDGEGAQKQDQISRP